jgi:membrane associated rhomboid family serine protease
MLPLRDRNPSGTTPIVMYGLIAANVAVFLVEVSLPRELLPDIILTFGVVPARVSQAFRGEASIVTAALLPALTSMFLHGGFLHLLLNMWFLQIFGDNVEGRVGHAGFLVFYLLSGLGATAGHCLLAPGSRVPMVGASGAIAGILGAYAVCWPRARIITVIPIFFLPYFLELPAVVVLVMWFLLQLLRGVASLGVEVARGGVAYWAHAGGFLVGIVLVMLWPGARSSRRSG